MESTLHILRNPPPASQGFLLSPAQPLQQMSYRAGQPSLRPRAAQQPRRHPAGSQPKRRERPPNPDPGPRSAVPLTTAGGSTSRGTGGGFLQSEKVSDLGAVP